MKEFTYNLKIPKERVGVLIGKDGEIKKKIEDSTDTSLQIDSQEGEIVISADDGLKLYDAKEVVRAIARGFNPEIALLLLKTDYILEIIDMREFAGKSKPTLMRLKGRVIGREGKSKREIETLTETQISIYGKTIAIVGRVEDVPNARKAVENLLQGATHASVFKFLEKMRRQKHMDKFEE
ncbi:KH domain-containing protein [Candidatus Woesearchaeota archaeon]|nr:KH domain-containing protein [Candidatus Woesearchaeota archaeon]